MLRWPRDIDERWSEALLWALVLVGALTIVLLALADLAGKL